MGIARGLLFDLPLGLDDGLGVGLGRCCLNRDLDELSATLGAMDLTGDGVGTTFRALLAGGDDHVATMEAVIGVRWEQGMAATTDKSGRHGLSAV